MKKTSIALVISLMAIGCENAKPPVAAPPMDMSKMHTQMAPHSGAHVAPAGENKEEAKPADEKPAGEKPAEGDAKPAEEPK